ncbi:MAG: LysR family transcriptional regulator [Cellulophaga sp.]
MISKINQIEFRHLRYFLALAHTLHYRKASEELSISQSALSQQIMQLETILNTKLFDRTNRKVLLNRSGILFLKEAKKTLQHFNSAMEQWQLENNGSKGNLKIGFVGSAMQNYLPPIIKEFSTKHPLIHLQLEELTNQEQLRALEQNKIDIAFMRSNRVTPETHIKSVHTENFSLVLPKGHLISEKNYKNIGQFSEESFILFPNKDSPMYYQQILNLCTEYGFSPKISHKSIHGPTIFKLVENGMGIAIIPNSLRDEFNYKIKFIELKTTKQKTELFATWNKRNDNPALLSFLKITQ